MKVYISGKITGLDKSDYMDHFDKAEKHLLAKGYSVINPAKVNALLPKETSYQEYMDMSFTMLRQADGIYMLNNWKDSNGAREEHAIALNRKLEVIYED